MLEETNTIDHIFLKDHEARGIVLGIVDSGVTPDPAQRMMLLLQKLNNYLLAIGSGRFAAEHPGKSFADFAIEVLCRTAPTAEMRSVGRISPGADAEQFVEVIFTPGPDAQWSAEDETDVVPRAEVSKEFAEIVNLAFGAGLRSLQDQEPPLMLLWMQDGEADFTPLDDVSSSKEMLAAAQAWAATAASDINVCAVVSLGMLPHESGAVHALVALCAERGRPESLVLALPLDRDPREPGVRARGEMFQVAASPAIFPEADVTPPD